MAGLAQGFEAIRFPCIFLLFLVHLLASFFTALTFFLYVFWRRARDGDGTSLSGPMHVQMSK